MLLDWQEKGACVNTEPDQWHDLIDHPDMLYNRTVAGLKTICASCPVQAECLAWALQHEAWGVWGGTTPQERKEIRQSRGITLEVA